MGAFGPFVLGRVNDAKTIARIFAPLLSHCEWGLPGITRHGPNCGENEEEWRPRRADSPVGKTERTVKNLKSVALCGEVILT